MDVGCLLDLRGLGREMREPWALGELARRWVGSPAGDMRIEEDRGGVLPPDNPLHAWDFRGEQGRAGAVLAGSMLWLLVQLGIPRPGWELHAELVRAEHCLCRGILPGPETCGGARGMGRQRGIGASWAAGPYRCAQEGWSGEPSPSDPSGDHRWAASSKGARNGDTNRRGDDSKKF